MCSAVGQHCRQQLICRVLGTKPRERHGKLNRPTAAVNAPYYCHAENMPWIFVSIGKRNASARDLSCAIICVGSIDGRLRDIQTKGIGANVQRELQIQRLRERPTSGLIVSELSACLKCPGSGAAILLEILDDGRIAIIEARTAGELTPLCHRVLCPVRIHVTH